jgi:hypothetical protein
MFLGNPSSPFFTAPSCSNQTEIGVDCNITTNLCEMQKPCQNNGNCSNNNTAHYGYICSCPSGFNGTRCELDIRPCKPNTCWNNGNLYFLDINKYQNLFIYSGICNETSNTTFNCSCQPGWMGLHCQTKINYCEQVKCLNKGVCRPLLLNFTCECLGTSYSGRYCEITSRQTFIYQVISKSFGYLAILILVCTASFIVVMDILKYCFGIDPTKHELEKYRRRKMAKRMKHRPVIQRFVYVNQPPPSTTITDESNQNIQETSI